MREIPDIFDPFESPIILPRWHGRIIQQAAPLTSRVYGCEIKGGPCCVWTGGKNDRGYGYVSVGNRLHRLHRYVYMKFHDIDLLPSEVVDHLCRIRACFNPGHVEAVEWLENYKRGDGPTYQFKSTNHLSDEDTEALAGL